MWLIRGGDPTSGVSADVRVLLNSCPSSFQMMRSQHGLAANAQDSYMLDQGLPKVGTHKT